MAWTQHSSARCKNKLCGIKTTISYYSHMEPNLVCPACGFKTLEIYHPELERIFKLAKKGKDHE